MATEHEQVREAIRQYNAEIAAKIELEKVEDARADATLDEMQEELGALAFGAGITREELGQLLERGDLGAQVLNVLTRGEASTVEEAVRILYQQVGHEIGKSFVDPLTRATGKKVRQFGPDPFGEMSRAEFDVEYPRRKRKPKTRADVQRGIDAWRARLAMQAEFDQSIDESMHDNHEV